MGAQNVWYQCANGPTEVSTVEDVNNAFQTKKLWKKFADYNVSVGACSDTYTCNPFVRVTNPSATGCPRTSCPWWRPCNACGAPTQADNYRRELPKILERMNRDPNVGIVRASIETLVKQAAERGTGMLWHQASGDLDLWQTWSSRSRKPLALGGADPSFWWPVAAVTWTVTATVTSFGRVPTGPWAIGSSPMVK